MTPIQVPSLSWEDLRSFHQKHFPTRPIPGAIVQGVGNDVDDSYQIEDYDDDEDGLGYYSDGAKRTLTDEQIAIFRHSEVEGVLTKIRKRAKEIQLAAEECATTSQSIGAYMEAKPQDVGTPELAEIDNTLTRSVSQRTSEPEAALGDGLLRAAPQLMNRQENEPMVELPALLDLKAHSVASADKITEPADSATFNVTVSVASSTLRVKTTTSHTVVKRPAEDGDECTEVLDNEEFVAQSAVISPSASLATTTLSASSRSTVHQNREMRLKKRKNKRRKLDKVGLERHDKNEFLDEADEQGRTYRRQAREGDSLRDEAIVLDY